MNACPICACTKARREFTVTRETPDIYATYREGDRYQPAQYWECDNCEAMLWKGRPEYEHIYDGFAYRAETGDAEKFIAARFEKIISLPEKASDNCQRVDRIKKFLAEKKRLSDTEAVHDVLDVGAGLGVFLYRFLDESWIGTAVEPDAVACAHMKRVLPGAHILEGYLNEVTLRQQFDLITINRMLEHVPDPYKILKTVRKRLKPGGYLYLELPDVRAYFENGPHDPDFSYGHYIVYSPVALAVLTANSGLDMVALNRVNEPSGKHTLYGFFRIRVPHET